MPVPRLAGSGDVAGGDFQRGEQRAGAVPHVVVGPSFGEPGLHRQHLLGPVQRLDLGLLIHTQHDRVLRRRQVQPDHVGDLRDQLGVGGELERLGPPGLHPVVPPGPSDRGVADPKPRRHQTRRPVCDPELLRRRLQRLSHDLGVIDVPRPTRSRLILQTLQPAALVPLPPIDHRWPRQPSPVRDPRVGLALGRQQHDPSSLRQPSPPRRTPHHRRQPLTIAIPQRQRFRSPVRHTPF